MDERLDERRLDADPSAAEGRAADCSPAPRCSPISGSEHGVAVPYVGGSEHAVEREVDSA